MNNKRFLPFMVLLGDEGNKYKKSDEHNKNDTCAGCSCLIIIGLIVALVIIVYFQAVH